MLFLAAVVVFSLFSAGEGAISKFYFADEFNAPETVLNFEAPQYVYVASTGSEEAYQAEQDIYISNGNGTKTIREASTHFDNNGYLLPVFDWAVLYIKVQRSNPHQKYSNPAIIYIVDGQQSSKVLAVQKESIRVELDHRITVLSPREMIKLNDFGEQWTPISVAAGGAEEARHSFNILHGVGAVLTKTNPSLYILEPVLTMYKEYGIGPNVYMNVSGNEEIPERIQMTVNWGDRIVVMSKGYKLKNSSIPLSFDITSIKNDTEFHVRLSGDVPESSQLTFKHNTLGGESIETIQGRIALEEHELEFGGNHLRVDYRRGDTDHSTGFFALVEIRQPSATLLFYLSLTFSILYLM